MTVHAEHIVTVLRVFRDGEEYGVHEPAFTVLVVGDNGRAVLKAGHGELNHRMKQEMNDKLILGIVNTQSVRYDAFSYGGDTYGACGE